MFVEATLFDSTLASSKPCIHTFTKGTRLGVVNFVQIKTLSEWESQKSIHVSIILNKEMDQAYT